MIDHFNLPVTDLDRSQRFYQRVLEPLGYHFLLRDGLAAGFGRDAWNFGIVATPPPLPQLYVAFAAATREMVDQFFSAALLAGATANGSPGIRAEYDSDYYAAFVRDLDGHNVEAVCRTKSRSA